MREAKHHISSAVVVTRAELTRAVAERLGVIEGVEVHAEEGGKIVVVLEGPSAGALGETLIGISAMDGVLAAHMVFEQALEMEETKDDDRAHTA